MNICCSNHLMDYDTTDLEPAIAYDPYQNATNSDQEVNSFIPEIVKNPLPNENLLIHPNH